MFIETDINYQTDTYINFPSDTYINFRTQLHIIRYMHRHIWRTNSLKHCLKHQLTYLPDINIILINVLTYCVLFSRPIEAPLSNVILLLLFIRYM